MIHDFVLDAVTNNLLPVRLGERQFLRDVGYGH